jgi:hypothetical protein
MVYAAVFATAVDCSSISFNWSQLTKDSPFRISLQKSSTNQTISINPKSFEECALAF